MMALRDDSGIATPHIAVLGRQAVEFLAVRDGGLYIDGTFGAGGYTRLILDAAPHVRGASSGALIPSGGLAALECSVARRVPAGDHLLVISKVENVVYVAESGDPLVRFRGRYPVL